MTATRTHTQPRHHDGRFDFRPTTPAEISLPPEPAAPLGDRWRPTYDHNWEKPGGRLLMTAAHSRGVVGINGWGYNPAIQDELRRSCGARWDPAVRTWTVSDSMVDEAAEVVRNARPHGRRFTVVESTVWVDEPHPALPVLDEHRRPRAGDLLRAYDDSGSIWRITELLGAAAVARLASPQETSDAINLIQASRAQPWIDDQLDTDEWAAEAVEVQRALTWHRDHVQRSLPTR